MKNISELDAVNNRLAEITHLLSVENILLFSSNPNVQTVQTLQTERARLLHRRAQLIFKEECRQIEASLPRFDNLSNTEIEAWLDNQDLLHWSPRCAEDYSIIILHENQGYYLAHAYVAQYVTQRKSWVARAWGVKITPKLAKKLSSRFYVWEN